MITIQILLFYHLKEKAGKGCIALEIEESSTIEDLIGLLEKNYPPLRTHLDNVLILMDGKIVLLEDKVKKDAKISFLTPIGGG